MKKVFLTLILTIGAVLIFTSCTKKQKIKTDRFDDQTINMSYQALSSITFYIRITLLLQRLFPMLSYIQD